MSKKHKKHFNRNGYGYTAPPPYGTWQHNGFGPEAGMPGNEYPGMGSGYGAPGYGPAGVNPNTDFLQGMSGYLPTRHTDQFLMGLMLGAGAAWILSDEELRGKLIKAGMKFYSGVAGGFEEIKEQMADIRAEVATERHGDE
ncbi:hypothetical protein [Methylobacter sp.]|uniref:hypothetical protein n=1 Tax=Methylobacter sp. TaxID=2051955 RepID=UPI002FDDA9CD